MLQSLNRLFQATCLPLRLAFIRIFTPLLVIELKRIDDHEQIIEILTIFETLLAVVDSSARESSLGERDSTSCCPSLGVRLALLIIPLFKTYLPTSNTTRTDSILPNYIRQCLQNFVSTYTDEYHALLAHLPELRIELVNHKRDEQHSLEGARRDSSSSYKQ